MALGTVEQSDFSGGIWRDTAAPANSAFDVVDGFVDGTDLVRRGGTSTLLSNAAGGQQVVGAQSFLTVAGERTLAQAADGTLWLLDASDSSSTQIATGVVPASRGLNASNYVAYRRTGGQVLIYGGSRRASGTSASTFNSTALNDKYTSSGQSWTSTVDAGMLTSTLAGLAPLSYGVVRQVVDNNSLTTTEVALAAGSAPIGGVQLVPTLVTGLGTETVSAIAAAGNRLLLAIRNRVYASPRNVPNFLDSTNFVEVPTSRIIGMQGIMNTVLVFTTTGVFSVANLAYDLTDDFGNVNWTVSQVSQEIVLWGDNGLAGIGPQVIAPALDGIYLMGSGGEAQLISRGIRDLYRGYVNAGYTPGIAAIHQGHYFLPILNGSNPVDLLVCKLDGLAWTRWGVGASSVGVRQPVSTGVAPRLIGSSGVGLIDASGGLRPASAPTADAGGAVPALTITTRDFQGRSQGRNLFKYARVRYELSGAVGPVTAGTEYATDSQGSGFSTAPVNDGSSPAASDGADPVEWVLDSRAQTLRLRIALSGQATRASVRSLQVFVRGSGKR